MGDRFCPESEKNTNKKCVNKTISFTHEGCEPPRVHDCNYQLPSSNWIFGNDELSILKPWDTFIQKIEGREAHRVSV